MRAACVSIYSPVYRQMDDIIKIGEDETAYPDVEDGDAGIWRNIEEDVGLGCGLDYGCKYARGDGYIYISLSLWYEKGRGNQRERGRGRGRTKNEASKREYSYWGFQRRRVILYLLFLFSS